MLRTEGSDEMFVTKIDETVNLVFKKNRWLIKSTDTVQEENKISKTEFYTDYSKAMKDSSDNAKKAQNTNGFLHSLNSKKRQQI